MKWLVILILIPLPVYAPSIEVKIEMREVVIQNELALFLDHLGQLESRGHGGYKAVRGQYWGKYQLGEIARQDLEVELELDFFLADAQLQDSLVIKLLYKNRLYLQHAGYWLVGEERRGVVLTEAGLLAGAHLVGWAGMVKWLNGEEVFDGNKISPERYIQQLGHYSIML